MTHFSASLLLLSLAALSCACQAQDEKSVLKDPYLGQQPPGSTPERFAPGIVSTEYWEYGGAFTPDLREFYLLRDGGKYEEASFVVFRYEDGEWRESVVSRRAGQPFISPDGKTMHLGRRYKKRTETGWSEIKELEAPFKDLPIMRLTASANGTYYFDTFNRDQLDFPIRYSRLADGKYEAPKPLNEAINTGTYLNHPFIAPDESYLLWDAKREDGYGDSDIYISFRQSDGSWGAAITLGNEVNTDAWEASASVTPDGKYLFFSRNMGSDDYENVDIFWVDAKIIEYLRPKNKNSTTTASPYFGQKPPSMIPEVFAPGIVSIDGRLEMTISFSSDFTEMYFSADNEDEEKSIYFSKREDDKWTPIKRVNFTNGKKNEEFHPFVSPDGKRIYFTAMDAAFTDEKIWHVNRLGDTWSDAVQLDSPINDDLVFFSNQAENGDLYYFNLTKGKTYYAPNKNGEFPEVREVALESGHHAFISPSQDYLILTARSDEEDGRRDNDMYVYFKEKDGAWAKPINLGNAINTSFNEKTPTITPDGKYLFFGRDESDESDENVGLANIYWVSTEVVERLRPKM
ncbi:TolB family protein [Hyphococcus sp.]|uniref:TolB family protein n=1 Tax=Hyphococcus sp. TaxID=2038636 RepID=UPI002085EA00|nr:MAG: hypothetical protein DHS20C04_05980 [Marinicaulis sp.]